MHARWTRCGTATTGTSPAGWHECAEHGGGRRTARGRRRPGPAGLTLPAPPQARGAGAVRPEAVPGADGWRGGAGRALSSRGSARERVSRPRARWAWRSTSCTCGSGSTPFWCASPEPAAGRTM
ncbi:hypothetical protein QJS66_00160 [Kocuria rhizophila]|nr:hypothetical protein QJS66_00160 [Kocuria rhizophila]